MLEPDNIYLGHTLDLLKPAPDGFVDCVVTSPPYWGLRDYGLEPIVWDAKEGCQHLWILKHSSGLTGGQNQGKKNENPDGCTYRPVPPNDSAFCSLCGAWRGSLGLEPTFQLYIDHLMQIMAECRRVLKDTGTMFVNIGDSYSNPNQAGGGDPTIGKRNLGGAGYPKRGMSGIPAKSLVGIPERFAIRMTDDLGMIRRNTIIWYKRNCMPSSASDRFTVDFEPVYFFVKQGDYWFKQQREPYIYDLDRWGGDYKIKPIQEKLDPSEMACANSLARERNMRPNLNGRNRRCIWDIPTEPSSEPHFAMFPQALVEPMIDAGCPPDGIVLDPFSGMGTVASEAIKQGKRFIGIELSPDYYKLSTKRIALELQQLNLFHNTEVAV